MTKFVELLVSLNQESLVSSMRGERSYDLAGMVRRVPTAEVVSGSASTAVQVRVAADRVDDLRRAVQSVGVIDDYEELEFY